MKKNAFALILIGTMLCLIVASLIWTGCTTASPLGQAAGSSLTVTDYKLAGQAVGEASYYAYSFLKQNPKYVKYTDRCEKIYTALGKAHEGNPDTNIDIAAVNDAALEVLNAVLTAKYGPSQAYLITSGARIAIIFATNLVKRKIPENKLDVYLDGVWQGIQTAKANGADFIAEPTEIDKLIALEPSEECGLQRIEDKIRSRLSAGGLTEYDEKRLKKRLKHFQEEKAKIEKEVAEDVGFCGSGTD
jgi:hypothetical protein